MFVPLSDYAVKLLTVTLRRLNVQRTREQVDELGRDMAADIIIKYLEDPTFRVRDFRAYIIQMIRNRVYDRKVVRRAQREIELPEYFDPSYCQDFDSRIIEDDLISSITKVVDSYTDDPELIQAFLSCVGRRKDYHSMVHRLPVGKRGDFEKMMEGVKDAIIEYSRG